jgi:hypothetical protein
MMIGPPKVELGATLPSVLEVVEEISKVSVGCTIQPHPYHGSVTPVDAVVCEVCEVE